MLCVLTAHARDVNTGDKFGRTPLMYCVLGDRMECAEMLIKANGDVNKKDIGGRTALHWAAHKVCVSQARLLLHLHTRTWHGGPIELMYTQIQRRSVVYFERRLISVLHDRHKTLPYFI